MGYWGTNLYENDIAEDTRIMVMEAIEEGLTQHKIKELINELKEEYEDEFDVALLVLADMVLPHGTVDCNELFQSMIVEKGRSLTKGQKKAILSALNSLKYDS